MRLEPGTRLADLGIQGSAQGQPQQPQGPRPSVHGENLEILSRVPGLTAPRDSTPTNGALREFLLDFIDMYITDMQRVDQGRHRSGMDAASQGFSDYFLQGYRQAMGANTGSRALGLNSDGMDMFYDSKTVDFFTRDDLRQPLGTFSAHDRLVSIAINTIHSGVLDGRAPEEIATTIIYEIEGRGRGWEPHLNLAIAEHFGLPNTLGRTSILFDPTMELAASNAAGGIHTLFEAADNGQDAMRDFMNANFRNVNEHFNFDYDTWQRARLIAHVITNPTSATLAAGQAFSDRGGRIHEFRMHINNALNPANTPQMRRESAERVNRYVAMLAEIGISLEIGQIRSVVDRRSPVVDLNNLDRGIVGQAMDFPNMTERVSGR